MKALSFVLLMLLAPSLSAQLLRGEFGLGYTYMTPLGPMQKNIIRGNGITLDYYITPQSSRFSGGLELSYTIYGHDKDRQTYTFDDGTVADMDVVVDNSITNLSFAGRYFLRDKGTFKPFITVKSGYSWFRTDLNIYDPDDFDHCEPVDNDVLLKDGTLTLSAGAGMQWDLSTVFRKLRPNRFMFNLSANLVLGGRVNYMNTDAPSHNNQSNSDVRARFVNTQTQVIHEHHVGYVYTSFVEMVDARAGFVLRTFR